MEAREKVWRWLSTIKYHSELSKEAPSVAHHTPLVPDLFTPPHSESDRHINKSRMQTPQKHSRSEGDIDNDETPTNAQRGSVHVQDARMSSPSKRSRTGRSDTDLSSTDSSTTSARSARKLRIIQSLTVPINHKSIGQGSIDDETDLLVTALRRCAAGFETVPNQELDMVKAKFRDDVDLEQNVGYGADSQRARLGDTLPLPWVDMIRLEAEKCCQEDDFEPGWNSSNQGAILAMATYLSTYCGKVTSANITTARILGEFLPTATGNEHIPGRMVDFALCVEPDQCSDFQSLPLRIPGRTTLNHTDYSPTASRPIAISIETKRHGVDRPKGQLQLDVWVSAHFNWLQSMQSASTGVLVRPLPVLPLLFVQGSIWFVGFAQRLSTEIGGATIIWREILLGDVRRPSGVYRVLAALLHLIDWIGSVYAPWFAGALASYHTLRPHSRP
ncbi:hypothetical protein C1H76_8438 [Elsinoe australis]|uniref:PD-(D/E)XK nuclease-like domain-containing protein n=1 Tax=Elsinoe australis TaxID=40998 RepID=A0A4U7ASH0_9PEZI|nr:hypothetical protein C1H76_8438 [Elsinoe australis]